MKRNADTPDKLGTLEFCTALNGEDPERAISFLKRFVQTVRRERIDALCDSSRGEPRPCGEIDITGSDDDLSIASQQPLKKKAKVEDWKLDSKSYNVPFVGTSTYKGPTGAVQKGKWPTGFLQAYLEQSPQAMEILGGGKGEGGLPLVPPHGSHHVVLLKGRDSRGKAFSAKLFALYIQALGEIATCGIPLDVGKKHMQKLDSSKCDSYDSSKKRSEQNTAKLEKHVQVKISYQQIISTIMKEHLPILFNVLNNEYTNSARQSHIFLAAVLSTLGSLSSTSVGAAREIIRGLDSDLKEGVLQRLAPSGFKSKHDGKVKDANNNNNIVQKELKRKDSQLKTNAAFLSLASIFLESDDSMTVSYAVSPGVKETKTKPGIAFIALRRVSAIHTYHKFIQTTNDIAREAYYTSACQFLRATRLMLLNSDNSEQEQVGSLHKLSLNISLGFFQGDVLENLTRTSCMSVAEDNENKDLLDDVKRECRLMVMSILSDRDRSPLLKQLHSDRSSDGAIFSCTNNLTRCIQILLSCSSNMIETRAFVLRCFSNSPKLFTSYLRAVPIPEPIPSFSCISCYGLITFLLDNGPSTWDKIDFTERALLSADQATFHIIPRGLTKNILTKGLQSPNALLLMECLKLIRAVMRKFECLINDVKGHAEEQIFKKNLTNKLYKRLPDLQVLLSVRSKFDPFRDNKQFSLTANAVVTMSCCEVLRRYTFIFSNALSSLQFDWIKFLPEDASTFCCAQISMQHRLLTTLSEVYNCYQTRSSQLNPMATSRAFRAFCAIMIETNYPSILNCARNLALKVLESVTENKHLKNGVSHHELVLWVDGITLETLPSFCKLLDATQKMTVQHNVVISNAWQEYHQQSNMCNNIKEDSSTPILTMALSSIVSESDHFLDSFIMLVCRIATTMLMYQFDPMLLATVIRFLCTGSRIKNGADPASKGFNALLAYSKAIVEGENDLAEKANYLLGILFGEKSTQWKVSLFLMDKSVNLNKVDDLYFDVVNGIDTQITAPAVLRQAIHLSRINSDDDMVKIKLNNLILKLLPILIQRHKDYQLLDVILEPSLPVFTCAIMSTIASATEAQRSFKEFHTSPNVSSTYMDVACSVLLHFFKTVSAQVQNLEIYSKQLAYVCGIIPLVPSSKLGPILSPIVDLCATVLCSPSSTSAQTIPLLHLLNRIMINRTDELLRHLPVGSIFSLWRSFLEDEKADSRRTSTRKMIEEIMAKLLTNYEDFGLSAANLVLSLQYATVGPGKAMHLKHSGQSMDCKFLSSLLSFNCSMYAKKIVDHIENNNVDNGIWDDVIATLVIQATAQKSCEEIIPSLTYAIDALMKRVVFIMSSSENHLSPSMIEAMKSLVANGQMSHDMFKEILIKTSKFLQSLKKCRHNDIPSKIEMEFIRFLHLATSSKKLKNIAPTTITVLLTHISSCLPKVLKAINICKNVSVCSDLLSIMADVLQSLETKIIMAMTPSIIKRIMVTSLKFGIQFDGTVPSLCLKIVRLLLTVLYAEDKLDESYKKDLFRPHQIYAMTISHSNFMVLAGATKSATRRELISLMITCMALGDSNITPTKCETFSALLKGFDAGLSDDDCLLRRFLFLYESSVNDQPVYCQSSLTWGETDYISKSDIDLAGSDHGDRWEVLIESLELRRIRQTIADFPVWETAKPPRQELIETWVVQEESQDSVDLDTIPDDNESLDEEMVDATSLLTQKLQERISDHNRTQAMRENENKKTDDYRYSPAFILPLILGMLESFALRAKIGEECPEESPSSMDIFDDPPNENEEGGTEEPDDDPFKFHRQSFVKVVYRLSQKGLISLSLCCLSSKCPDMRKLSVSTLYLFLQAVQMEEAQSIVQWRERPQLEMILNSVQRGLAVARAKKAKQLLDGSISFFVPMLPTVSAIFLARSVLIGAKPSDEMYSCINRHFLRIQDYHGAYNDCFSLPAFMTLFCSTQDDNNQARRERLWALQLLKDGVVDEYSYNVVARRHVPELLLSSFDGFCCRHHSIETKKTKAVNTFNTECYIILDALERCFNNGGVSAYHHLVKGIGMFPWILSMIESHSTTPMVDVKFFQMVQSALEATIRCESTNKEHEKIDLMTFDPIKLARNVVCAYETKEPQSLGDSNNTFTPPSTLLSTVCRILSRIQIHTNCNDGGSQRIPLKEITFEVNRNGIPISAALVLMKKVKHHSPTFDDVAGVLCSLPVAIDVDEFGSYTQTCEEKIIEFCKISLSHILKDSTITGTALTDEKNETTYTNMLTSVMKRIKLLTSLVEVDFSARVEISELVVACRRRMTHAGHYDIWFETLLSVAPLKASKLSEPSEALQVQVKEIPRKALSLHSGLVIEVNDVYKVQEKAILLGRIVAFEKDYNRSSG